MVTVSILSPFSGVPGSPHEFGTAPMAVCVCVCVGVCTCTYVCMGMCVVGMWWRGN